MKLAKRNALTVAVLETLENRQMLAGYPLIVRSLPYTLDFGTAGAGVGIRDKDGSNTGFSLVQPNAAGNEYQPSKIDLDTAGGVLKITSTGDATTGSNSGTPNTQINVLQNQFDATKSPFKITARLKGPLGALSVPFAQAGIIFGADADNFVKLVAVATSGGQVVQFLDEQTVAGNITRTLGTNGLTASVGNFSSIGTLDLTLNCDPTTNTVKAFYGLNGNAVQTLLGTLTIANNKSAAFFSSVARAGIQVLHKNSSSAPTVSFDRFTIEATGATTARPTVNNVSPANAATNVLRNQGIVAYLNLPNGGVDPVTVKLPGAVKLIATNTGVEVAGNADTSGGGDTIVFQPQGELAANTKYTFQVTALVKDEAGASFQAFSSTFTTGAGTGVTTTNVKFNKVSLPTAQGKQYSGLTIGPDGKLYATALDGNIYRWAIGSDGTLGSQETISTVKTLNNSERFITGLVFDPKSTASNLTAYVSHSAVSTIDDKVTTNFNGPDWTGKITRLSGANLETYADFVVGLPRSVKDHLTNQPSFGPDGKLYVQQGASNSKGEADSVWGNRGEHLLTGAVLQIDVEAIKQRRANGQGALNVKTEDTATPYNPFATGAAVKIYASGVRNGYDMVWHSNGNLYVAGNSSGAGGVLPSSQNYTSNFGNRIDKATAGNYPGTVVPGNSGSSGNPLPAIEDFLYNIKPGKFYGQPNPSRAEFVMNGGNPTSGKDPYEYKVYPVGTQPDRNYQQPAYVFGLSYSPNGTIEYKSNTFGGALKGKLLITRWSLGDDIIALSPRADGSIDTTKTITGATGLTGFTDPLDLVEDTRNGNIYVAEFERSSGGVHRITLLKPNETTTTPPPVEPPVTPPSGGVGAKASISPSKRVYNDVAGGAASPSLRATIKAPSNATLKINSYSITGANASMFQNLSNVPVGTTLAASATQNFSIAFNPPSGTTPGIKTAVFTVNTSSGVFSMDLRGLSTTGTGGNNEPSLQKILELHQLPIDVGDDNVDDTTYPVPPRSTSTEVTVQQLVKAGPGNVTIEPLAAMAVDQDPAVRIGYYDPGTPQDRTELFQIRKADAQWVNPGLNGNTTFDPGNKKFGLFGEFPLFKAQNGTNRIVYSEDVLNQWETTGSERRKVRFFPLKNTNGGVVPNAYVFAFEEFESATDQNDFVGIIRNVNIAYSGQEWGVENTIGFPAWDRVTLSRIDPAGYNATFPNKVRDNANVRVFNTGPDNLTITSAVIGGPFTLTNFSGSRIVAPGTFVDLNVKFTATGGGLSENTLTINTNDSTEPSKTIALAGLFQKFSEYSSTDPKNTSVEPNLQTIVKALGYTTTILKAGQTLDTQGNPTARGDEVISPYWQATHSTVEVIQLAAYHNMGFDAGISWYAQGKPDSLNTAGAHDGFWSQSMFPGKKNASGITSVTMRPTGNFGFRFDISYSDPVVNKAKYATQLGTKGGHLVRFYPLRDTKGNLVPNTYLVGGDNLLTLPDYQDNVYIVRGIKPSNAPAAPESGGGYTSGAGLQLAWAPNKESGVAGYNVYRSTSLTGAFTKLNASPVAATSYFDAVAAGTYYYRLTAVDTAAKESTLSSFTAVRV